MSDELRDARRPGFFHIDNVVLDHFGEQIGAVGIAVYAYLVRRANQELHSWPSYSLIATKVAVSRPTAINAVRRVRDCGLITVRTKKETGKRPYNVYTIVDTHTLVNMANQSTGKADLPVKDVSEIGKAALPEMVKDVDCINTQLKQDTENKTQDTREARAPATPTDDTTYPLTDADYAFGAERGLTAAQVEFATAQWRDDRVVRRMDFATAAQREADWRKWIRNETRFLARAGPREGRIAANLTDLLEQAREQGYDVGGIFQGHGGTDDELPAGAVEETQRALPAGTRRSG